MDALDRAVEIARGRLEATTVGAAELTLAKVRDRAGHGTGHTVVALVGSTGVGKSSLFNSIAGETVSSTGVRRPTTSVAHAAIWGSGSPTLLDWLHVGRRHHIDVGAGHPLAGLVLIDLPDFDSTETSNRAEVDRVIELVDALVWVVDPQKYADEAFHDGYVRHFADYGGVMRFVVNKIDTVAEGQRSALIEDFARRVVDDGVPKPSVISTSVAAGDGLDALQDLLVASVTERRAMTQRLEADLRGVASGLMPDGDGAGLSKGERRRFVERLGHAAGADAAGAIVDAQHRHDARAATGWPAAKLVSRWRRRHPIADLPRVTASRAAGSEVELALRDVAEAAGDGLAAPWPRALRDVAAGHAEGLRGELTALTNRTARDAIGRPRWWTAVRGLQHGLTAVAIAGALWLLGAALLGGFFQLDTEPLLIDTPGLDWIPLPSLMVLGGLLLGLLVGLLARIPTAVAARRRGRRVRSRLLRRIERHADASVLADLDEVLVDRRRLHDLLRIVASP